MIFIEVIVMSEERFAYLMSKRINLPFIDEGIKRSPYLTEIEKRDLIEELVNRLTPRTK